MAKEVIKLRRDLASNWTDKNPILALGEAGFEYDTNKLKIGNGTDVWADLQYIGGSVSEETIEEIVIDYLESHPIEGDYEPLGAVATHVAEPDPHGDRAYTDAEIIDLTKADVGLPNVDNTSDANKPVSTAQAAADAAVQAASIQRANHTGSQPSSSISDFTEAVQDAVAAFLTQGTNVTLTHNDGANTLTIDATGGGGTDDEGVRDVIAAALAGTGLITVTPNDGSDTITISTTATANDTDANLKARANHTGTQAISTVTGLQTALDNKAPIASPTFTGTVSGVTKSMVGLGNVDNTADTAKPVSTAQQAALDVKQKAITISTSAPSSPSNGDMWYRDSDGKMLLRYSGTWVEI